MRGAPVAEKMHFATVIAKCFFQPFRSIPFPPNSLILMFTQRRHTPSAMLPKSTETPSTILGGDCSFPRSQALSITRLPTVKIRINILNWGISTIHTLDHTFLHNSICGSYSSIRGLAFPSHNSSFKITIRVWTSTNANGSQSPFWSVLGLTIHQVLSISLFTPDGCERFWFRPE